MQLVSSVRWQFVIVSESEPNLVHVPEPMVIIGDIHGQFYDLIHMFEKIVDPQNYPAINLVFLGDYVDRGQWSIECVCYLLALKISYPKNTFMLRGNHESRSMSEHFTFREECLKKFDAEVYELFMDVFDSLPLAIVAADNYLCVHGGISPELKDDVQNINKINRFVEPPL
jgi:serine/threonine-protein phosphatase 2B catalytic subunit